MMYHLSLNHMMCQCYQVVGTMGYAAPEYIQTGRLTSKSDVWSYGVFLYELITGRRPLDRNRPKSEQKLLEWVKPYLDSKKFRLILDPRLEGKYSLKEAQRLSIVANRCLARHPKSRPKMSEVLEMVNRVLGVPTELGSPRPQVKGLVPIVNPKEINNRKKPVEISKDVNDQERNSGQTKTKGKRCIMDIIIGDGAWFARMWSLKIAKTC